MNLKWMLSLAGGGFLAVLAVCEYLMASRGIPLGRQVIMGESLGCTIAFRAAETGRGALKGLVMLSPTELPKIPLTASRRPEFVHLYQGEGDTIRRRCRIEEAPSKYAWATLAGGGEIARVLVGEGHNFHRVETWGEIYARIVDP